MVAVTLFVNTFEASLFQKLKCLFSVLKISFFKKDGRNENVSRDIEGDYDAVAENGNDDEKRKRGKTR